MAKLDKLKKKLKQLKRELKQQSTPSKKEKRTIEHLKRELEIRDKIIADLQCQLASRKNVTSELADAILVANNDDIKLALNQKNAWKKHTFLCERYDVHLESGHDKDTARTMANKDLMDRYGKKVGFTAEQLRDILS